MSYGSATKALGYLARMVGSLFSGEDNDENAALLTKKKAAGENKFMATACCCCFFILICVVGGFVAALRYLANPSIIPKNFHHVHPTSAAAGRAAHHFRGRHGRPAVRDHQGALGLALAHAQK